MTRTNTVAAHDAGNLAGVERGLQRSLLALLVPFGLLWLGTVIATPALGNPVFLGVVLALVAVWIVVGVHGWRVRLSAPDAWAVAAAAVVVLSLMPHAGSAAVPPGTRVQLAVVPAILAAGFLAPGQAVVICMLVAGAYLVASVPVEGTAAIGGLWPIVAGAVAAAVLVRTMRTAAGAADAAHADLVRAGEEDALAAGRHAAHREFQRLLHDHVSAALRTLADGLVSAAEIRQACRVGVDALVATSEPPPDGSADLAGKLGELAGCTRTPLDLDLDDGILVPSAVAGATVLAVAEALRNVDRHARATRVVLTASRVPDGFTVTVRDNGIGRSGSDRSGAVGVRRSVIGRMADVGGAAVVDMSPSLGTTVTVSWTKLPAPVERLSRAHLLGLAVGDVRRPLAAVCVPYLIGMGVIAAMNVGLAPHPSWLVAWYAVVCTLTGLLLWRADRPMGWVGSVTWIGVLLGLVWIGLLIMPSDGLAGYASWPIGAVGPILTALAVLRPPWESLVACVAEMLSVVLLILLSVLSAPTTQQLLPALFSPLFGTLMGGVIAATVLRFGRGVARARADQLALVTARARRDGRVALHRDRVAEIGVELAPFLDSVAGGAVCHDAPEVRARAAELDQLTRDELHLPGVLDPMTRSALAAARARGCAVAFHVDADTVDVPGFAASALRAALDEEPPDEVTLSVFPQSGGLRVCLVAVPGDESRHRRLVTALRHLSPTVDATDDATCVEVLA